MSGNSELPQIVVVREGTMEPGSDPSAPQSIVELRHANGDKIWEQTINNHATSLLITDFNKDGSPDILVSSDQGGITAFNLEGDAFWRSTRINGPVNQILAQENSQVFSKELLIISDNTIFKTNINQTPIILTTYPDNLQAVYGVDEDSRTPAQIHRCPQ